jgi:excisionase family DNA binding protein
MPRHFKERSDTPEPAALTVEETADYLRISRAGVWRLLKEQRLPRARIGARTVIRRIDVDDFLAKCARVA